MVPGVKPKQYHFDLGGAVFNLFFFLQSQQNGATSEGGAKFFLNVIIKGKNGSTLQSGTVFKNGSRMDGAVLAPPVFSV